jgi:rhomboid family GlyGly-CTERM serine protease
MMLGGEPAQATWQYHRLAIADGQWWRLLTGHLAHISVEHFFWDALMFITLGSLVEWQSRARWLGVTLGSAVAISAGLWWLRPDMMWYRGLSGIDSALFACIMAGWLRHAGMRRLLGGLGLILLLGKAGYEWQAGQAIFVQFDQPHVTAEPLAHLIGGGVGAAVGWWRRVTGHLRCFR